jgi:hypothetical protein
MPVEWASSTGARAARRYIAVVISAWGAAPVLPREALGSPPKGDLPFNSSTSPIASPAPVNGASAM